jgi:hypothetical protein
LLLLLLLLKELAIPIYKDCQNFLVFIWNRSRIQVVFKNVPDISQRKCQGVLEKLCERHRFFPGRRLTSCYSWKDKNMKHNNFCPVTKFLIFSCNSFVRKVPDLGENGDFFHSTIQRCSKVQNYFPGCAEQFSWRDGKVKKHTRTIFKALFLFPQKVPDLGERTLRVKYNKNFLKVERGRERQELRQESE